MASGTPAGPVAEPGALRRFLLESQPLRGHWTHLGAAWQELRARRNYPPPVDALLGEAATAAVLLTATLKFAGTLTLQLAGNGRVRLLVAQCTDDFQLRAVAHHDLGAGEVDVRNVAHEKDDQARLRASFRQKRQCAVAHVIDVEVEERSLGPEHQDVRQALVVQIPTEIGEVRRAWDASNLRHAWTRGSPDEEEQRKRYTEHHSVQQSGTEDAQHRDHRYGELRPAEAPDVAQRLHLHEAGNGHQDDRRENRPCLRSRGSCGQVRLCDEFRLERRLDVQHRFHRHLDAHCDDRHVKI